MVQKKIKIAAKEKKGQPPWQTMEGSSECLVVAAESSLAVDEEK